MKEIKKIVIAGGSGFLGRLIAKKFTTNGIDVVVLSRNISTLKFGRGIYWDGKTLENWKNELEDADVLINLAGKSVDCRYNAKNKEKLFNSRILSTRILGQAILSCNNPPKVWMNASTATIYEHTYGEAQTEKKGRMFANVEAKDIFSVELAKSWEKEFNDITTPKTRKVLLRMAMIFDNEPGTVYTVLRRLVKFGLGGKMGHGKQFVSWIHAYDFCNAIEWILNNDDISGAINISAPEQVTNSKMMEILRNALKFPFGLPATKFMLEIGAFFLRTETELIIKSRSVAPQKLLDSGFVFKYEKFEEAIKELAT